MEQISSAASSQIDLLDYALTLKPLLLKIVPSMKRIPIKVPKKVPSVPLKKMRAKKSNK